MEENFNEDPTGTLKIEGQVVDENGSPISGVTVALSSNPTRYTTSEEHGWFFFENLSSRLYYLDARKENLFGLEEVFLDEKTLPVTIVLRQGHPLTVTVLDANDRHPIQGATVSSGWRNKVKEKTNAAGKAVLLGCASQDSIDVYAEGYAPYTENLPPVENRAVEREVLLVPGAFVSGVVLDPKGSPIEGAEVLAEPMSGAYGAYFWRQEENKIRSDAEGKWKIPSLGAGTYRFVGKHKKFASGLSAPITLDGKTPQEGVVIQLEEGATLSGRVVHKDQSPAPGAGVYLVRGEPGRDWEHHNVYANDKGEFLFEGLRRARFSLDAAAEQGSAEAQEVDLSNGDIKDLVVVLSLTAIIQGIVIDSKSEPVAGAMVFANPKPPDEKRPFQSSSSAISEEDGRFTLKGLPDEKTFALWANKDGMYMKGGITERVEILANSGDTNAQIVLEALGSLTGKLLYEDGTVPKEATVSSLFAGEAASAVGPDGSFQVKNLHPGKAKLIANGKEFFQKKFGPFDVQPGAPTDVGTLTVKQGRTLSGRVIEASGAPVEGAKVIVGEEIGGSGSELYDENSWPDTLKGTRTAADGSFRISGLPEKELRVIAEHPTKGRSQSVKIAKEETTPEVTLTLAPTGALEGLITYQGKPISAQVAVSPEDNRSYFAAYSGEDGLYRLDTLTPGRYRVTAVIFNRNARQFEGSGSAMVTIEAKKTAKANIDIPRGVLLSVKVLQNGKPPQDASVNLLPAGMTIKDSKELKELLQTLPNYTIRSGHIQNGAPTEVKLKDVLPGSYSLCVVPRPSTKEVFEAPAEEELVSPAYCSPLAISKSPETQETTVTIP